MFSWLGKWWPVLVLCAFMVAMVDGVLSSLLTCHPVAGYPNQAVQPDKQQNCTALAGPLLASLAAIVHFIDEHGDAFVALFTAVLAIFTGRLWFSTEKLWTATNNAAERQEADTRILRRAYLSVAPGGCRSVRQRRAGPSQHYEYQRQQRGQFASAKRIVAHRLGDEFGRTT